MKTHELKTWPEPFEAVMRGLKRYEIRSDDRDFEVGDTLMLREFIPHETCQGSGRLRVRSERWGREDRTDEELFRDTDCCPAPHGEYTGREFNVTVTYKTEGGHWGIPSGLCVMSLLPVARTG